MTDNDAAELDAIRRQLTDRFIAHKPSTWSISLLRTVVNAIDVEFGPAVGRWGATGAPHTGRSTQPRLLTVVRGSE